MSDAGQIAQDQKVEPQNSVMPSPPESAKPPLQPQPQPINNTVTPIPSSVYKKHRFPLKVYP